MYDRRQEIEPEDWFPGRLHRPGGGPLPHVVAPLASGLEHVGVAGSSIFSTGMPRGHYPAQSGTGTLSTCVVTISKMAKLAGDHLGIGLVHPGGVAPWQRSRNCAASVFVTPLGPHPEAAAAGPMNLGPPLSEHADVVSEVRPCRFEKSLHGDRPRQVKLSSTSGIGLVNG